MYIDIGAYTYTLCIEISAYFCTYMCCFDNNCNKKRHTVKVDNIYIFTVVGNVCDLDCCEKS